VEQKSYRKPGVRWVLLELRMDGSVMTSAKEMKETEKIKAL
jgi:hypothetical protein